MLKSDRWVRLSLSEQYEMVFGAQDPSRKKLKDLPYTIKIISRKEYLGDGSTKCVYCNRTECQTCPLPFDDKLTLK